MQSVKSLQLMRHWGLRIKRRKKEISVRSDGIVYLFYLNNNFLLLPLIAMESTLFSLHYLFFCAPNEAVKKWFEKREKIARRCRHVSCCCSMLALWEAVLKWKKKITLWIIRGKIFLSEANCVTPMKGGGKQNLIKKMMIQTFFRLFH